MEHLLDKFFVPYMSKFEAKFEARIGDLVNAKLQASQKNLKEQNTFDSSGQISPPPDYMSQVQAQVQDQPSQLENDQVAKQGDA